MALHFCANDAFIKFLKVKKKSIKKKMEKYSDSYWKNFHLLAT